MEFIKNWTIDLELLPNHDKFKQPFYELINKDLCDLILKSDDKRLTPIMKSHFKTTIVDKINNNNILLPVIHNQRFNIGRFYPDNDGSLIVQSRLIKHTIFSFYNMKDLDQIKGHPTIICEIGRLNNEHFNNIDYYINNFDLICNKFIKYYSLPEQPPLDDDDVKKLFNLTIYGGGFKSWLENLNKGDEKKGILPKQIKDGEYLPEFINFKKDIKKFKNILILNNPLLLKKISNVEKSKWENENKVVSYYCQAIENHALFLAYEYLVDNNIIKPFNTNLEYDGCCIPPYITNLTDDEILDNVNRIIYNAMNINIKYKFKGYKKENILNEVIIDYKHMNEKIDLEKIKKIAEETERNDLYNTTKLNLENDLKNLNHKVIKIQEQIVVNKSADNILDNVKILVELEKSKSKEEKNVLNVEKKLIH